MSLFREKLRPKCEVEKQIPLAWDRIQFLLDKPKYCFSFDFTVCVRSAYILGAERAFPHSERLQRVRLKNTNEISNCEESRATAHQHFISEQEYNRIIYNYLVIEQWITASVAYSDTANSTYSMQTHYIKLVFFCVHFFSWKTIFCLFTTSFLSTKFAIYNFFLYFDTLFSEWSKQPEFQGTWFIHPTMHFDIHHNTSNHKNNSGESP